MDGRAPQAGCLAAARKRRSPSTSPVGVLAGFDPDSVAYLRDATSAASGRLALDDIDLRGTPLAELAFDMVKAPMEIVAPRAGIHVYADHACPACRRFVAGAMRALAEELCGWRAR